jgi:hypothetical protein
MCDSGIATIPQKKSRSKAAQKKRGDAEILSGVERHLKK